MTRTLFLCFSLLLSLSWTAFANGNAASGQSKSMVCSACHGEQGISTNPLWPNLAGQHAAYLLQQLKHYKDGKTRPAPMMIPMVATLSAQDMEDLAEFYAKKPFGKAISPSSSVTLGERLYRQGDMSKHIPACIACHGPDGRGAAQAGFPVISHQQPEYLIQQLQAFKSGTRTSDPLAIMRTTSEKLSVEDMRALAEYLAGLD
ncbi:MAG: cytochrome c4 [Legionella sp.]|nr:MAG: cytochrome c4 [Legionella sp.]